MEDKVLDTVVDGIKYTFTKDILVKPLPAVMIEKEYTEQIPTGKTDKEGFNEYETKTHTKKVESAFGQGIILSLPTEYKGDELKVGDTVVYPTKFAKEFDLFKDSLLIKVYDVVALKK